ncbi:MAG: hypothetical protein QF412_05995, partial [Planctomycetota bacterium]|nr:hypothetical protein [Planctomycetota bacterium]
TVQIAITDATGKPTAINMAKCSIKVTGTAFGNYSGKFAAPIALKGGTRYTIIHAGDGQVDHPRNADANAVKVAHYWRPPTGSTWSGPWTSVAWCIQADCTNPPPPELPANITNYGTPCGFEYDGKDAITTRGTADPKNVLASLNAAGGALAGRTLPNEYCYGHTATADATIYGIQLYTKANGPAAETMTCGVYGPTASTTVVPAASTTTGSMKVGTALGWYTCSFAKPVKIKKGETLWVSQYETTKVFPADLAAGTAPVVRSFWRRPAGGGTPWSPTGIIKFPAWKWLGGGGPAVQVHNLTFNATKLPANAPTIFIFGLKRLASPIALPIGKCSLVTSQLTLVNGKADARGNAGFKGSTTATKGVRFYSQAVALDSANNTLIASTGMSIDFTYTYDMGKEFASAVNLFMGASDNKVLAGLSAVFKKPIDANLKAYQAGIQQAAGFMKQAAGAFAAGSAAEKAALLKNPTYLQMVGIFGTAVSEGLRTIAQLQVLLPGGPKNAQAVRDGLNDMSNALTAAGFAGQQLMGIYAQTTTLKPCGQLIGGMLMAAQAAAAKLTAWLP